MKTVELLAPVGSKEALTSGLIAGADAFYIGGSKFGARAYANNPTEEELIDLIKLVHIYGKKIYLTLNTLVKNNEMKELIDFIKPYYENGVDAIIVQDYGVIEAIKENYSDLPIHASTQMSITSEYGAGKLREAGITRVVPAREISLKEIKEINDKVDIELECFIHGAMCYAFSGQCLFSSILGGRSGNRGRCAQPCRLPYGINGKNQNDYLSMKDLNTLDILPDLLDAGVISFKIEGRMKSPEYVYTVVSIYRKYIDLYYSGEPYKVKPSDMKRLNDAYQRRGYSNGYYHVKNGKELISLKQPTFKETESSADERKELPKLPVAGNGVFKIGKKARLSLVFKKHHVLVESDAVIEGSKNRPALEKDIRKQLQKTGNTSFFFEDLQIEMDEDIFIPVKTLNELRRLSFSKLSEELLAPYYREKPESKTWCMTGYKTDSTYRISARVEAKEQLNIVQNTKEIERIYADISLLNPDYDKQKIYPALPYIFRKDMFSLFERKYESIIAPAKGVMIRNLEELGWLHKKGYKGEIISDYNMYIMNNLSKRFLTKHGIKTTTLPFELNKNELKYMETGGSEMIVYGRIPLMITANCLGLFMDGCSKSEKDLYLEDRKSIHFPVKNYCNYCYNIIYNSTPLSLFNESKVIKQFDLSGVSLLFTTENEDETRQVLSDFKSVYIKEEKEATFITGFTKGHFNRGVL